MTRRGRLKVTREQILAFRARASQLDHKLSAADLPMAAWGGLQDTIPRAGVIGLHARAQGVGPDSWDDPALCQIWFRGADYIVPRSDVGTFTLGARPRDAGLCAAIDDLSERVVEHLAGREIRVREVHDAIALDDPMSIRSTSLSGRVLIRWNASLIWVYGIERPDIDEEDARLDLARRFLGWLAPQTRERFAWWAGALPADATVTWDALAGEMVPVEFDDKPRFVLERDVDALRTARPVEGVRLVHNDDPLLKFDHDIAVTDPDDRTWLFPTSKQSRGYAACAVLVNGEPAGVWQRQQRKVTIHPWRRFPRAVRDRIEQEALTFPIAARSKASVTWDE